MTMEDQGPHGSAGELQASVIFRLLWLPVRDPPSSPKAAILLCEFSSYLTVICKARVGYIAIHLLKLFTRGYA